MRITILFLFLLFLCFSSLQGQQTEASHDLMGIVLDSIEETAIPYAPIIMTAQSGEQTTFTQTDDDGKFNFAALPSGIYRLEVNYLGFSSQTLTITTPRKTPLRILLQRNVTSLAEITVRDTLPPMTIRGDTVIYNAIAFYREEQRHLRDLVNRLPGLSVDEENKITYQGKPVDNLLVEGKPFFGGDNELALNNFPANAVGRVEVIQNYDRTGMGGIFTQKKEMALNVLLREDKKNVLFGEATLGAAPNFHNGDINAFNYNRKANVYTILGANNVNKELLSIGQRFRLLAPLNASLPGEVFSRLREFNVFASPTDVYRTNAGLVTLGMERIFDASTDFNLYGAFSPTAYTQQTGSVTTALPELPIDFQEVTRTQNESHITTGMLRTDFIKRMEGRQKITVSGALNTGADTKTRRSVYIFNEETPRNNVNIDSLMTYSLSLHAEHVKRFAKGRANYFSLAAEAGAQRGDKRLRSSEAFLDSLVSWPVTPEEFLLAQDRSQTTHSFTVRNYYFCRLSSQWGLTADTQLAYANWQQRLSSTTLEQDTETALNDNRQRLKLASNYKSRRTEFKVGLAGERLTLVTGHERKNSRLFLLPTFEGELIIPNAGILSVSYQREITKLRTAWYQNGTLLTAFNSVQLANPMLFPFAQSQLNIGFSRSDLLKGSTWFLSFNATEVAGGSIIDDVTLNGNIRTVTPISTDRPERNANISFFLKRDYTKANFQFNTLVSIAQNWTRNSLTRVLDPIDQQNYYGSFRYSHDVGKRGRMGVRQSVSISEIGIKARQNTLRTAVTEANVSLAIGPVRLDGIFKAQWFNDGSRSVWQNALTANVSFRKPKSPWTFSTKAYTPLGDDVQLRQNITALFVSSHTVNIFPSYAYLSISRQF